MKNGCKFVDDGELRPPRQQPVEIHLLEGLALVGKRFAGKDFKTVQQRLRFQPPVSLDNADHNINAGVQLGMRALQHFIGLANAGSSTKKYLQATAAVFAARSLKQCFR